MEAQHDRTDGCFVCRKHRGETPVPGGWIYSDDLVRASHVLRPTDERDVYLGWVVVEPNRHVPGFGDLTDPEAQRIGLVISRVSHALTETESAEHVYVFVLGHHVPHLHVHVIARYPGTPRDYWGTRVDEWPDAPRGGDADIAALAERLHSSLAATQV